MAVDDARMERAFIHFAPVGIRNRRAQDDRCNRRKREQRNDEKRQDVPNDGNVWYGLLSIGAISIMLYELRLAREF